MPHTCTGKARTSRPDSRPNAKRRKKERVAAVERADVRDLRATSTPKNQQKERRATGELRKEELPPDAKRARYLQKLLRQIEALQERKDNGDKLDAAQLQKLGRMNEVVCELEELFGVDLGSSDEEDEAEEQEVEDDADSISDGDGESGSDDTEEKMSRHKEKEVTKAKKKKKKKRKSK